MLVHAFRAWSVLCVWWRIARGEFDEGAMTILIVVPILFPEQLT